MKIAYKACLVTLALACPLAAEAGISLVIDTVNNQFWFTGSDTGTLKSDPSEDVCNNWNYGTLTGTDSTAVVTDAITINGSTALDYNCVTIYNGGGLSFYLLAPVTTSTSDDITLVADSTKIYSYGDNSAFDSSWSATSKLNFEALIGKSILSDNTSFDSITVVAASSIPEPATYAGLAGLGALGLAALRRRKRLGKSDGVSVRP